MKEIILKVDSSSEGMRLDKYISSSCGEFSRSYIQKIITDGLVSVNGRQASKGLKVSAGDEVTFIPPEPVKLEAKPQNIPLDIVYEDDDLLVVNKPRGMVVHPAAGNYDGTLVNALMFHC